MKGMIIDCSYISEARASQVLGLSRAPAMFSHSNSRTVFSCARNFPGAVLDQVPANGGIVMVMFVPEHVSKRRKGATMELVLDHLLYIAGRISWDHVGLGGDFNGIANMISRLKDVKYCPHLIR